MSRDQGPGRIPTITRWYHHPPSLYVFILAGAALAVGIFTYRNF